MNIDAPEQLSLRHRLDRKPILTVPGVFDGLSALIAEQVGFSAVYLSGASVAYTKLGRSDVGLVTMSEMASTLSAICERIAIPVIVDADTGFGNAINVQRTVRDFERCGASAIQLEDQSTPKRCGHLSGKSLVSAGEMVGKIKAALDARRTEETLIIARTDAIAVEGADAALDRAESYLEAGADVLFIEAPRSRDELGRICQQFAGRGRLMANMVEGGTTPLQSAADLEQLGFSLVIFPGGLARATARMMQDYFSSLKRMGSTAPYSDRMLDFAGLNAVIGTPELLERGRGYDGANFEKKR
ncbi:MAG TPA: isocitrate lyase/PEP mutase family protein [Magnetospirillaceae bacterium]